jgi:hypothetical protein
MSRVALGRGPAKPGIMERPPRALLVRAWLFPEMISAVLVTADFLAPFQLTVGSADDLRRWAGRR